MAEGKETVVLGDMNLDWLTCLEEDPPPRSQAARTRPLVEELPSAHENPATRCLPVCPGCDEELALSPGQLSRLRYSRMYRRKCLKLKLC